jgi:uncharacterized GH25 family protein
MTALILVLVTTVAASAHDTWLNARHGAIPVGRVVHLDLTSGMAFPTLDYAIKPDRLNVARYRLDGKTTELRPSVTGAKSLQFRARMNSPGIATFWVSLKPRSLELTAKQVEEYFEEINATATVRERWANGGPNRRWRETYTKHAKTFVNVGDELKDDSWSQPVGMALEIVPEKSPATLRMGDDFPIRVVKNGAAFADFSIGIFCQGDTKASFQKTDSAGVITFRLARAGNCLLSGTDLHPSNKPNVEWESNFTTLAIHVR